MIGLIQFIRFCWDSAVQIYKSFSASAAWVQKKIADSNLAKLGLATVVWTLVNRGISTVAAKLANAFNGFSNPTGSNDFSNIHTHAQNWLDRLNYLLPLEELISYTIALVGLYLTCLGIAAIFRMFSLLSLRK